jgi:hypothetical protein
MSTEGLLQLQQPLKDGGIRSVNFFNGRLLTGKDLSREQAARREADARLGLAKGDGVAFGLEASRDTAADTPKAPVLRVKAGLAVNRKGQTLRLTADTSVGLTRRFASAVATCVFADCQPSKDGVYVAGAGVYVLTIAPAQAGEGRAPTNGLDPSNVSCNTDTVVEGVQFRLHEVNGLRYAGLDVASRQFRNRIAYRCFGIEAREQAGADAWRVEPPGYGLVDELRAVALSDFDVPLALLYWTAGGLQFVDTWAVRRMIVEPDGLAGFPFVWRTRRLAEAQAMCAQFEEHVRDVLADASDPASVKALEFFRHLPPFGMVPLVAPPLRGFDETTFFSDLVRRPLAGSSAGTEFIDARLLGALREAALVCAPTDVTQKEFLWVYRAWQNVKAAQDGRTVQPMVVFASGLTPDIAVARFDMARFDFSNYAHCCGGS